MGIWIQNDLKWDKNISEITTKTNRCLHMLRLLKRFGFSQLELCTVYQGYYLRPLLEYADTVWHSSLTAGQSKHLEQLQRRACRMVLDEDFISHADALQVCDLETLSDRRKSHCVRFAQGLSKSIRTKEPTPSYQGGDSWSQP